MRGSPGEEPVLLNKITGSESRTVPPLYLLLLPFLTKVSHWVFPGRLMEVWSPNRQGRSQKTYACVLSQKNGCGVFFGRRSLFVLEVML